METEFKPDYAIHPGVILGQNLKELHITQTNAAVRMGIKKSLLNEIIKGKRDINADYAIKLEPIFGLSAQYWMNLQAIYDEALARSKSAVIAEIQNSGDLNISIPIYLKKKLAAAANEENVTINEYVISVLSENIGYRESIIANVPAAYAKGCEQLLNRVADLAENQLHTYLNNRETYEKLETLSRIQRQYTAELCKKTSILECKKDFSRGNRMIGVIK